MKVATWKWAVPAVLLATCGYLCSPHEYDVTGSYSAEVKAIWCTTADHFLVRFPDSRQLHVEVAGNISDVPRSVADYQSHPTDWYKLPAYADTFNMPGVHPGDIQAAIPAGTKFRVVKVVKKTNPETGTSLTPQVVFFGPVARFGVVDAGLMGSSATDHGGRLKFDFAVPCATPPN